MRPLFVSILLVALGFDPAIASPPQVPADSGEPTIVERVRTLPLREADEVVWLARCLYSETARKHEQRLVAWVVRNRVETGFRGETYRDAVLNPAQFSAFNRPSPRRTYILNLSLDSPSRSWKQALEVAYEVYTAPDEDRPFPPTTRHFYSPVSMSRGGAPHWTRDHRPIPAERLGVDSTRFRFYDGIDRNEEQLAARRGSIEDDRRLDRRSDDSDASGPSALRRLREIRKKMREKMNGTQIQRPRRPAVDRPDLDD